MNKLMACAVSCPLCLGGDLGGVYVIPRRRIGDLFGGSSLLCTVVLSAFAVSFERHSIVLVLPTVGRALSCLSTWTLAVSVVGCPML